MKVALVTIVDKGYDYIAQRTNPSKNKWCEKFGYDYHFITVDDSSKATWDWVRFDQVLRLLPDYEYVMWMDADALIANQELSLQRKLETFAREDGFTARTPVQPKFIISTDLYGINAGVFIAKRDDLTEQFLYAMTTFGRRVFAGHPEGCQAAMNYLFSMPPYRELPTFVEQRWMNSYPGQCYKRPRHFSGSYEPGDWVCHFAGLDNDVRMHYMAQMGFF